MSAASTELRWSDFQTLGERISQQIIRGPGQVSSELNADLARLAGRSKFGLWRLWNFALEGITSFSTAPLRVATYIGLLTATGAFAAGVVVVAKTLLWGDPVAGWPTMMVVILFLGSVQLIALGMIGEYLGRLYDEAKQRPLYLVDTWQPAAAGVSCTQEPADGGADAHGTSTAGRQAG